MTGFSIKLRWVSRGKVPNTSRSASSAKLFEVRTNVVRPGSEFARVGWILEMRLRARRRFRNLGERGKFPRVWMSLSVKSIQSHGCNYSVSTVPISKIQAASHIVCRQQDRRAREGKKGGLTPATPRFSIEGILCPISMIDAQLARSKCSISPFQSTHLANRVRAP